MRACSEAMDAVGHSALCILRVKPIGVNSMRLYSKTPLNSYPIYKEYATVDYSMM